MIEITRTVLLVVLGLAAILFWTFPPTYFLWQLKIVITEFPHVFLAVTLTIFCLPFYSRGWWIWPQLTLLIWTISSAAYPLIAAKSIGNRLASDLNSVFGKAVIDRETFSLLGLLAKTEKEVPSQEHLYLNTPQQRLGFRFYPTKRAKAPVVVVIHGGGWDSGDNTQLPELNSILANQGYAVVAMNYSLAPKYTCPRPSEDVLSVLSYLKNHQEELNIDAEEVVLLGRSAGGQIALHTAYSSLPAQVKGVIAYYAPADMVWGYDHSFYDDILGSRKLMDDYLGGTKEKYPERYNESSPLFQVKAGIAPTLMIHGQKDNLVAFDHNLHLIEKLKPLGAKYYLLDLPWATHGADYNINGPSGQLATYAVLHFLKKNLN